MTFNKTTTNDSLITMYENSRDSKILEEDSWFNGFNMIEKTRDSVSVTQKNICFPRNNLSESEVNSVLRFESLATKIAYERGVLENNTFWNFQYILDLAEIDVCLVNKAGLFYETLWVVFLDIARAQTPSSVLKYQSLADFLIVYPDFVHHSEPDQLKLFNTANWMHIFLTLIPAKKNKGLAMQVVPKLVEGWNAKYVTGSGQTQSTAERVHIYEMEGQVEKNVRGRGGKTKKKKGLGHPAGKIEQYQEVGIATQTITRMITPVYATVSRKPSKKRLCSSPIIQEQPRDSVTWKISGGAFPTGSTDGEDNASQPDDTDNDPWNKPIDSQDFSVNDEMFCDLIDLCEVPPALMRTATDRQALVQLLDDVGGSENPAMLETDIPSDVFSFPATRKRCRELLPPPLSRQVSWGSSRVTSASPLPTYPAQHSSLAFPNDSWLSDDI